MKKQQTQFKKYIKWFWGIFLGGFAFVFLLFIIAALGGFGSLPSFQDLENPQSNLATEVISADGVTIGKYAKDGRTSYASDVCSKRQEKIK